MSSLDNMWQLESALHRHQGCPFQHLTLASSNENENEIRPEIPVVLSRLNRKRIDQCFFRTRTDSLWHMLDMLKTPSHRMPVPIKLQLVTLEVAIHDRWVV